MAEGSETPGGDPPRRSEGDLLAERRARRSAESGDAALARRAEAAEATVSTLETHVASLQQRLSEAEEERRRMAQRLQDEHASLAAHPASVGDNELRPRGMKYPLGKKLAFDAKTEKFVDDAAANKLLTREYRKGFEVPAKA